MDEDGNPVFDEDGTIVMERVSEVVKTATITCTYKVSPSEAAKKKIMEYYNVPQDEDTVESDTSEADLFDEEAATMRQLYNAAEQISKEILRWISGLVIALVALVLAQSSAVLLSK